MSFLRRLKILVSGAKIKCPACFEITTIPFKERSRGTLKCEDCSQTFPLQGADYFRGKNHRMYGLVGAKNSGKTHYIAILLGEIRNHGVDAKWALQALPRTGTDERFNNEFYNPIYHDDRTLNFSDVTVGRKSLNYLLRIPKKESICLNFYDTSGESLSSEERIERESIYIANSDALTLLLDPLQLLGLRKELEGRVELPARELASDSIITNVANVIRAKHELEVDKVLDIPLAVVFSKIDLLFDLLPENSPLRQPSGQSGVFDEVDFNDVDSEIRALLDRWGGRGLIAQAESNFKNVAFFGISALGCQPSKDGVIPKLEPMRIHDPLIWQLNQHRNVARKKSK